MAWIGLVKRHHTDRNPNSEEAIKEINAAWNCLKTPEARREYDRDLYIAQHTPPTDPIRTQDGYAHNNAHPYQPPGQAPWNDWDGYDDPYFVWDAGYNPEPEGVRIRIYPIAAVAIVSFIALQFVYLRDCFFGVLPGVSFEPVLMVQEFISGLNYGLWATASACLAFGISQRAIFVYTAMGMQNRRSQIVLGLSLGSLIAFEYLATVWAPVFLAIGVAWTTLWYEVLQQHWLRFRYRLPSLTLRVLFAIPRLIWRGLRRKSRQSK
jgi:hypothetical protein